MSNSNDLFRHSRTALLTALHTADGWCPTLGNGFGVLDGFPLAARALNGDESSMHPKKLTPRSNQDISHDVRAL